MWGRIVLGVACLVLSQTGLPTRVRAQEAAPAGETGTIAGVVLDKASGEPIIEAGVEVVDQKVTTKTDLDGKYVLKLPPGQYQIRIGAAGYQPVRLQGIIVKANAVVKQNASLPPAGQAGVQVVEVVAQANRAAEATQLLQRKKAAVVSDTVSAEVIAKSTSSDAAQVVQRVPAVTVKDDKFVFVRGLSDRYSSSLLNGSRLPSTDPDRRVTPLDLFPASFLESLNIVKTYEPDLPGDFTAGLVDIHLREFPEQFTLSSTLSTGGNSASTFRRFNTNHGGTLDYIGLGSQFRGLPDGVPDHNQFPDPALQPLENQQVGRLFRDTWGRETEIAPPNAGGLFSVGDTIGKFGFELGGVYSSEYEAIRNATKRTFASNGDLNNPIVGLRSDFKYDQDTFKTRLGGVFTAAYKLTDNDKLTFRSLIDRNTSDETRIADGSIEQLAFAVPREETRFRYLDQELDYGQLAGEHKWSWLELDWRSAFSRSFEHEPDTRQLTYQGTPLAFNDDGQSGERIFNNLDEYLSDSGLDFTVPFKTGLPYTDFWSGLAAKLKFGAAYAYRTRSTSQNRYIFNVPKAAFDLTLPPEELFDPNNIGPGGITVSNVEDKFRVSQEIGGGYTMLDVPLVRDQLRLVGGVRVESSYIRAKFKDQQGIARRINKNNVDPLPAVNLVYSPRDDMNLHLAWSETVSRPDFRELNPVIYVAQRQDFAFQGNPNLVESHIVNWDVRWDWFFSPLELASLSFFYKTFDQPIEPNIIQGASDLRKSFENGDTAWVRGIEMEGRKDFGFLGPAFKNLSLTVNAAHIDSEVTVTTKKGQAPPTNPKHAFPDQAPYVVNGILDYTHPDWGTVRLIYNNIGERINAAGTFGLPDLNEESRHSLDMTFLVPLKHFGYPFTIKLGAENLLNDRVLFKEGDQIQQQYQKGIKVILGFTYDYN